jgi:hypothetical protein
LRRVGTRVVLVATPLLPGPALAEALECRLRELANGRELLGRLLRRLRGLLRRGGILDRRLAAVDREADRLIGVGFEQRRHRLEPGHLQRGLDPRPLRLVEVLGPEHVAQLLQPQRCIDVPVRRRLHLTREDQRDLDIANSHGIRPFERCLHRHEPVIWAGPGRCCFPAFTSVPARLEQCRARRPRPTHPPTAATWWSWARAFSAWPPRASSPADTRA